ncbi:hypothetical protein ACH5RR_040964 [Cinchona calisaya]|uniref:RING-type E3 ubiquitin transferase n=1 Tax=Cinchona calisaya TaxID=153742 RepID=A0ABD2XV82_9GENT
MDEYSGKRHIGGVPVPRKGSSSISRDTYDNKDQNGQFCNRIGCSGRLKYSKSSQIDCVDKTKYSRPSFRSSNGKDMFGSSSGTSFPITSARKSPQDPPRKFSSHLGTDSSESCGVTGESDVPELIPSLSRTRTGVNADVSNSSAVKVTQVGGSSGVGSNIKSLRVVHNKCQSGCQNALHGPSITSTSNSKGSGARNNSNANRCGLRNLKCNSISNVIPQGGLPSESKTRTNMLRKSCSEGESSSSSKGKRGGVAPSEDGHGSLSNIGISISGSSCGRNWASNNDSNAASGRNRRSMNARTRTRLSTRDNMNISPITESNSIIPQLHRSETHNNSGLRSLSYQSSIEAPSNASSSYTLPGRTGENVPGVISFTSMEHGVTHALLRHNLNGVAEVLLALERIEQHEELTYEQLLALENNLFLGNLNFYDQHRDMRLDIDNMPYEELLALEERMGTVSTALSDEAFAKCIRKGVYQITYLDVGGSGCCEDEADIKCSICQEEYAIGDEIGKLECEHGYHVVCIQQWLRLKNWCPICKASAAPSQSSLS